MNTQKLYPVTVSGVIILPDGTQCLVHKKDEIRDNDIYFDSRNDTIERQQPNQQVTAEDLQRGCIRYYFKVIACEYPHKIEGLYQYKLPDEHIEIIAEKEAILASDGHCQEGNHSFDCGCGYFEDGYIKGYKANKSLYTEEDKFLKLLNKKIKKHSFKNSDNSAHWKDTTSKCLDELKSQYLQSLHKNKEIESVEVEYFCTGTTMQQDLNCQCFETESKYCQLKTDKDGLLIIHKINYHG